MTSLNSREERRPSEATAAGSLTGAEFDRYLRSLVTEYDLSVDEPRRRVTLTLKKENTVFQALVDLQLGVMTLRDTHAVSPAALHRWSEDDRFRNRFPPNGRLSLEVVGDSLGLSKQHQEQKGLNDVSIAELALAHTAFLLITGEHLVPPGGCRAADGTLRVTEGGLREELKDDGSAHPEFYSSRRIPCL
jgi:hypothetical protein